MAAEDQSAQYEDVTYVLHQPFHLVRTVDVMRAQTGLAVVVTCEVVGGGVVTVVAGWEDVGMLDVWQKCVVHSCRHHPSQLVMTADVILLQVG